MNGDSPHEILVSVKPVIIILRTRNLIIPLLKDIFQGNDTLLGLPLHAPSIDVLLADSDERLVCHPVIVHNFRSSNPVEIALHVAHAEHVGFFESPTFGYFNVYPALIFRLE